MDRWIDDEITMEGADYYSQRGALTKPVSHKILIVLSEMAAGHDFALEEEELFDIIRGRSDYHEMQISAEALAFQFGRKCGSLVGEVAFFAQTLSRSDQYSIILDVDVNGAHIKYKQ